MNTALTSSEFTIEFPASPTWFQTLRRLVFTASVQCGFSDRNAGQIAMAVDEALTNIHRHGYQNDEQGRVILHIRTTVEPVPRIDIQIDDDAEQVDVSTIQSRNLDEVRPGGLGVHLIQTIMDESIWETRDSGGMRLRMSKTCCSNTDINKQARECTNG